MAASRILFLSLTLLITQSYLCAADDEKLTELISPSDPTCTLVAGQKECTFKKSAEKNLCDTERILKETSNEAKKDFVLKLLADNNSPDVITVFRKFNAHKYRLPNTMRGDIERVCTKKRRKTRDMRKALRTIVKRDVTTPLEIANHATTYLEIENHEGNEERYSDILKSIWAWDDASDEEADKDRA